MAIDAGTIAIIGLAVAFGVTILVLIICFIIYCCMQIQSDTNVRQRVLVKSQPAHQQVKTVTQHVTPPQMPHPQPVPHPMPPQPPVAPQSQHPEVVVHEVVHRYEPSAPEIALPAAPMSRVVRRSSWSGTHNDEWVMIKKKKKRSPKKVLRVVEDSSSSDDDDEPTTRYRLAPYDLACARPMGMVAGRPVIMAQAATPVMMTQAMPVMGMTGVASTFQPTYGVMMPQM